jgi:hypothetical protein
MSQKTSTSLSFPLPKFQLGQPVKGESKSETIKGIVVGFHYTSRDAALAMGILPGWSYVIETPAFDCLDPHHYFTESQLQIEPNHFAEVSQNGSRKLLRSQGKE